MTPPLRGHVRVGTREVAFAVTFAPRATLALAVEPDGRVTVTAPEGRTLADVEAVVRSRGRWVLRQLRAFERLAIPDAAPRRYVSGSGVRHLGRRYRLRVVRAGTDDAPRAGAALRGRFLYVAVPDPADEAAVGRRVEAWQRARAAAVLPARVAACLPLVRHAGVAAPAVRLRAMLRRWGSCTPSGTLLLNPLLVEAPLACVDYVVLHELCHLVHPNHGQAFYRLLTAVLPDWPARKTRLGVFAADG